LENKYLVQAFALKNLAIVHQQYFNDPVGGYPKGYGYYGDQFAVGFIRHLKGKASQYHIDPQRICCFGHSKGSEVPGMLVNKLRAKSNFLYGKVDFKKLNLSEREKAIFSPNGQESTEIACAILGAGVANNEMRSEKMLPWNDDPARNISPFFIFADHVGLMRERTREIVAKAKAHGVIVETAELNSHTWPFGEAYDRASAFADRILQLDY
jgi:acetyl esterase/lipase